MSPYAKTGNGRVPAEGLLADAVKALSEIPASTSSQLGGLDDNMLLGHLRFDQAGLQAIELKEFFDEALKRSRKKEPIVESGNKYGVHSEFTKMNGELLMVEVKNHPTFCCLSPEDRTRAEEFCKLMFFSDDLRCRNPLHPSVLDGCVLGNLLNFPKHIFGFPYASYATNGNESLSLILYSYRQLKPASNPSILYVATEAEREFLEDISLCTQRLAMEFVVVDSSQLAAYPPAGVVCVMTSLECVALGDVAKWANKHNVGYHIHIHDAEWRNVFVSNPSPVHFDLPGAVQSISIQEGLFHCGYSLYRDVILRDMHYDVPEKWQTAYLSPNEGGSGGSTPLFCDFCLILLGWSALTKVAGQPVHRFARLQPIAVNANSSDSVDTPKNTFEAVLTWAKNTMNRTEISRQDLEARLVDFQLNFLGGRNLDLEALISGGGTRSINYAFESVLLRAKATKTWRWSKGSKLRVITGNPHLAVERAERRFGFDGIRIVKDGGIDIDRLREEIRHPSVIAVYAQSLSYTDGISDDLPMILKVVEEENRRRTHVPVTIINDCCLAFSVLVHNNGENGSNNVRLLDLVMQGDYVTPCLVTIDAHKHLGTDKGCSTIVGTRGALSCMRGHVKVGSQPSKGELVRGLADLYLVGVDGYYKLYHDLIGKIEGIQESIESAGMTIIHSKTRIKGSSVIAVEDPAGIMTRRLKKKGHGCAMLFDVYPENPNRCQSGWSLSLTPYAMRPMSDGKSALDIFHSDLVSVYKDIQAKPPFALKIFKENSLLGNQLSGGLIDMYVFGCLSSSSAFKKGAAQKVIRRFCTFMLDCGGICSLKRKTPIKQLFMRFLAVALFLFTSKRLRSKRSIRAA